MDVSIASAGVAFLGGLLSVASPCVLPVVPILLAIERNLIAYGPCLLWPVWQAHSL